MGANWADDGLSSVSMAGSRVSPCTAVTACPAAAGAAPLLPQPPWSAVCTSGTMAETQEEVREHCAHYDALHHTEEEPTEEEQGLEGSFAAQSVVSRSGEGGDSKPAGAAAATAAQDTGFGGTAATAKAKVSPHQPDPLG